MIICTFSPSSPSSPSALIPNRSLLSNLPACTLHTGEGWVGLETSLKAATEYRRRYQAWTPSRYASIRVHLCLSRGDTALRYTEQPEIYRRWSLCCIAGARPYIPTSLLSYRSHSCYVFIPDGPDRIASRLTVLLTVVPLLQRVNRETCGLIYGGC